MDPVQLNLSHDIPWLTKTWEAQEQSLKVFCVQINGIKKHMLAKSLTEGKTASMPAAYFRQNKKKSVIPNYF